MPILYVQCTCEHYNQSNSTLIMIVFTNDIGKVIKVNIKSDAIKREKLQQRNVCEYKSS